MTKHSRQYDRKMKAQPFRYEELPERCPKCNALIFPKNKNFDNDVECLCGKIFYLEGGK